jgi:nucleotide-binding universal stress UspA family protein
MKVTKHLLVAVDDSEASQRAVSYVAQMLEGRGDVRILLLHVPAPVPPQLLEFGGAEDPAQEQRGEARLKAAQARWMAEVNEAVQPLFARAQAVLRAAHIAEDAVQTQLAVPHADERLETSILEAAQAHACDTVVVGRESFSWLRELFQAHVAESLLKQSRQLTLWIVQ